MQDRAFLFDFCLLVKCLTAVYFTKVEGFPTSSPVQGRGNEWLKQHIYFLLTNCLQAAVAAVTFKYLTLSFLLSWGMAFIITLKRHVKVQLLISLWQIIITPRNYINTAVADQTDIMTSLTALPFSSQTFTEEQQTLKLEDQLQDYNWQTGRTHWKAFKK